MYVYSITINVNFICMYIHIFQGQYTSFHEDLVKTYGDIVGSVSVCNCVFCMLDYRFSVS